MVKVVYQMWSDRSGVGRFGEYLAYERLFHLLPKAEGFIEGLKLNPNIRGIELVEVKGQ